MSYSLQVLQKLSHTLFPGVKLDRGNASRLAAALKSCAQQLTELESTLPEARSSSANCESAEDVDMRQKKKSKRPFDFSRFKTRFVAFELYYVGWDFRGFASQDHEANTVEGQLFSALRKVCLIPEGRGWDELQYSRCGRTDIGVSASGQTIALTVRSSAPIDADSLPEAHKELDYPLMLNRVLPSGIRIMGWTPAHESFHARYSATFREYKYYMAGARSLDVPAMLKAAKCMEGAHDFSNMCRMNLANSAQHVRTITHADVSKSPDNDDLAVFTVRGKAFIWHQVRCMAAVLLMVGQGLEEPSIVDALLDVETNPCKPQYNWASDAPLLLYRTGFDQDLKFIISPAAAALLHQSVAAQKADLTERLAVVSAVHARVMEGSGHLYEAAALHAKQAHIPLLKRGTDPSFAERLHLHQSKRSKTAETAAAREQAAQMEESL